MADRVGRRQRLWGIARRNCARIVACAWFAVFWSTSVHASGETFAARALAARIEQLQSGRRVVIAGATIAAQGLIADFYAARRFQPVWTRKKAHELQLLVASSLGHGLDPKDYHAAPLRRLLGREPRDGVAVADREIVLTDALVRLVYHFRFGKSNPFEMHPSWNFVRGRLDPVQVLASLTSAASLTAAVRDHAPRVAVYDRLRRALVQYRSIAAAGGWRAVAPGPMLRVGSRESRVRALRARLAASPDASAPLANASSETFDSALRTAVERFQARHGLAVDGIVGPQTLSALNVDVGKRIDQLRVNLDRVRWAAPDLGRDHLLVDIAGFVAHLRIGGRLAWASRVVVGRPYRSTPAFRAILSTVVVNPSWTVPPTILREDVLPGILKDDDYLTKNRMRVVDATGVEVDPARVDWRRYLDTAHFPYEIVQAPGPSNPLGSLKFVLPNPHAVYLHDSPARDLFDRHARAFSSGCIRIESAQELATALLDDLDGWNADALDAAIASGETRTLLVKHRVPVLLLYFTAQVDDDGSVHFRPDVYRRDDLVLAALSLPFRFHRGAHASAPR